MLTSSHILKDCLLIETRQDDSLSTATLNKKSTLLDISVISSKPSSSFANFREGKEDYLTLGEDMFTIGYPLASLLSGSPNLTSGNISSLGALKGSKGFIQFTAPIQPGSSGSPAISKKGEILGMVSSTLNLKRSKSIPQNVNFAVSGDLIMKYLTNNNIRFSKHAKDLEYSDAIKTSNDYTAQVICYK